jgi:hypothetical protein
MGTRAVQKVVPLRVDQGARVVDKAPHTRAISRCPRTKKTLGLVPSKKRRIHLKITRPRPLPQRRMSRWQTRLRRMPVKKKQKRRTRPKLLNCQIRRRLPLNPNRNHRRSRQEVDLLRKQTELAQLRPHRSGRLQSRSRRLYLRGPPQRQAKQRRTAQLQPRRPVRPRTVLGQFVAVVDHGFECQKCPLYLTSFIIGLRTMSARAFI